MVSIAGAEGGVLAPSHQLPELGLRHFHFCGGLADPHKDERTVDTLIKGRCRTWRALRG